LVLMNIKQLLIKLEKATPAALADLHIARFFVKPDESRSDFKARCHDAVYWPIGENSSHLFMPM
jgi:hypothetical protein